MSNEEESERDGEEEENISEATFESLGVVPTLCEAIKNLGWNSPTEIQQQSIPHALVGKDIIGLAETGSGK